MKRICEAMGGGVFAESAGLGEGATFTFYLPLVPAPPDDADGGGGGDWAAQQEQQQQAGACTPVGAQQAAGAVFGGDGHRPGSPQPPSPELAPPCASSSLAGSDVLPGSPIAFAAAGAAAGLPSTPVQPAAGPSQQATDEQSAAAAMRMPEGLAVVPSVAFVSAPAPEARSVAGAIPTAAAAVDASDVAGASPMSPATPAPRPSSGGGSGAGLGRTGSGIGDALPPGARGCLLLAEDDRLSMVRRNSRLGTRLNQPSRPCKRTLSQAEE